MKLKTLEYFGKLVLRIFRAYTKRPIQFRIVDQPAVSAEEHALFAPCYLRQFGILVIVSVDRIESGHPQMACELTKVNIQDELRNPQRVVSDPLVNADIEGLEHGVDAYAIPLVDAFLKRDGGTVEKHKVDLSAWYAV